MKNILLLLCGLTIASIANAETRITHLQVEYTETPIGIDVRTPRFGWQMEASAGQRDLSQTYYQLEVRDPKGGAVWNSGKVAGAVSAGVSYAGSALQPATRYSWTVKVWNNKGEMSSASSWFETGLMNPAIGAWEGASWIGGGEEDLVLYSKYLALFVIKCDLSIAKGSSRASVIFAANDPRLMERYKNIFQVELGKDQSYFKVELDIAAVDGTDSGRAKLKFFRAGYTPADNARVPVKTFDIPTGVINRDNKYASHQLVIKDQHGDLSVSVDGGKEAEYNLNPVGPWGDYIGFGMLCDMGFSVDEGQHASFSNVTVSNVRDPSRVLFREDKGVLGIADPSRHSMPMLRTKFTTERKKIAGARLYVTARGIYEMYLNGRRVGDDYYNPGLTQYNITHLYQTYDVTDMVNKGDNALGAMLGEGWWSGLLSYGSVWNHFGDRQSLLAKLVISYDDGTRQVITSNDGSWKYFGDGPVIYSSLDMGEVYDATREELVKNWSTAGYDDSRWTRAKNVPLEGTADRKDLDFGKLSLIGQIGRNAGIFKVLTAQKVKQVAKGIYIYNMGQNFTGVPRIHIVNGRAGQKLTVRVAEMLYPDLPESGKNVGLMMTENYRAALSQDTYVMRDGEQVWQPHFTSHGYQYIEISGMDEALPLEAVQGVAISSVRALTSGYETSNEKVNKLWSNLVWSNVDNFLTIPTDCPQRNERMGWSGDISVFSRTATYISNADQFLRRHMFAMRDVQSPAGRFTDIAPVGGGFGGLLWGSAGITVPWEAYLQYNDTALLREHYPAMVRYINYLDSSIDRKTGLCKDRTLGDWLGPQNSQLGNDFLVTAYHVYDLDIICHVAQLLGNKADARRFEEMHRERKAFFNKTFVGPDKKAMGFVNDTLRVADVETAYAVGLALNIFDSVNIPYMADNLKRVVARGNTGDDGVQRPPYSLMTGFIGTAWINKALSDHGGTDAAYKLLQNDQFPSWLYSVDQGSTTIWERLNGYTTDKGFGGNNGMNSFNHYSFGAVGQWMMAYSLGIQRGLPGFKQFVLQPEPDPTGKMTWAKGYYDGPYGRISSSWKIDKGEFLYEATVPANTTAVLYLPARDVKSIRESGHPIAESVGVRLLRYQGGVAVLELHSGSYMFRTQ